MRPVSSAAVLLVLLSGCPDTEPDEPSSLTCDLTPASTAGPLEWEEANNILTLEVDGATEDVTVQVTTTAGIVPPDLADTGSTDMDGNLTISLTELPFEEELSFDCVSAGPGTVTVDVAGLTHQVDVVCPDVDPFYCDVTPPDDLGPLEWESFDNVLILEVDDDSDVTVLITATPGIEPPNPSDIGSTDEDDNLFIEVGELPFEEELLFGCDGVDPGTITIEVRGSQTVTHTVQVRCPDVPGDETFLIPAADPFPDAIELGGAMASSDGTTLRIIVPYPPGLARPAEDEHDVLYSSGSGTTDGGRRFGECSGDTLSEGGRDPACVIFDESFLSIAQEPASVSFEDPLTLEVPLSAGDGALTFTVDGTTMTMESLELFLSRRNEMGILEDHVLSVDVPALVALME